ncbi:ERVV2 protein, partial [Grus americana]|nr:ERVV2 protein [Grus americana]
LASPGGVCATTNISCCMYIDQNGTISTEIRRQSEVLHKITKDDTSWGFEEIWHKLTSWLPNLTWLRQLFGFVLLIGLMIILTCVLIQCAFWCSRRTSGEYANWKRNKIRHAVEPGKYFKRT